MARGLSPLVLLLMMAFAAPLHAATEADAQANKLFVEAVQLTRKADNTYDAKESVRLLRGADQILKKIIASYPQSEIAVQLSTHQLIGDFDIIEFEGRIRALSCARGSYVEDFLADYGIASDTGPLTDACFLYRMENLLLPPDSPITQARADWLSVAVGYYLNGQEERARGIILPYMALLRKSGAGVASPDSYLLLAKAFAATGAETQAQQVSDYISDCSNRLSFMLTVVNVALGQNRQDEAKNTASQMRSYAEANSCDWQLGLVAQALALTGQAQEAKAFYDKIIARRSEDSFSSSLPPGLAVASALLDDPAHALTLARSSAEQDLLTPPQAVYYLARRGEYPAAHDFAIEPRDPSKKAMLLAALIAGASFRNDLKSAEVWMNEIQAMRREPTQATDQALVLASLARAEKSFYKDERWRSTFQQSLNAAERADDNNRGTLMATLAGILTQIRSGRTALD